MYFLSKIIRKYADIYNLKCLYLFYREHKINVCPTLQMLSLKDKNM